MSHAAERSTSQRARAAADFHISAQKIMTRRMPALKAMHA
jgi:hypothetical protein